MFYHFKIHKESGGYWAECLELKGCQTQADSRAGLEVAMKEALDLYLSEPMDSDVALQFPQKVAHKKDIVEIKASPRVAFAALLRYTRLLKKMTQKQVANQMGFKSVNAYQKLESAKTANPGIDTMSKIKDVFPEFSVDRIF